jgi:LytR cell envelope-related transcriptional attenuator
VTGKLDSLLSTASQYLITDSTFNLLDFATDMRGLTGSNVSFTTLPFTPENNVTVPGYTTPQDVNIIDVPGIQRLVLSAFDPQKAAATATAGASAGVTVDVYNGNPGANGLADQVSQALAALGYQAGKVTNSSAQSQAVEPGTQVFDGPGASAGAQQIALQFGAAATALSTLPAGHVEVLIGSTVTQVPAGIASSSTPSAATQAVGAQVIGVRAAASQAATPTPSSTAGTGSSSTGGSVTVAQNAPYGIPCVY